MKKLKTLSLVDDVISQKIYIIRGRKVMIDRDLAELYGVTTGALNQAVKRNIERFPKDFMFQLTGAELKTWVSQIVIPKSLHKSLRIRPLAFTEQGVAMLSSVLRSERAIQVNIHIMRMFTRLREMLEEHKDLREKIDELEKKYDGQFRSIFFAIKRLLSYTKEEKSKRKIGFNLSGES